MGVPSGKESRARCCSSRDGISTAGARRRSRPTPIRRGADAKVIRRIGCGAGSAAPALPCRRAHRSCPGADSSRRSSGPARTSCQPPTRPLSRTSALLADSERALSAPRSTPGAVQPSAVCRAALVLQRRGAARPADEPRTSARASRSRCRGSADRRSMSGAARAPPRAPRTCRARRSYRRAQRRLRGPHLSTATAPRAHAEPSRTMVWSPAPGGRLPGGAPPCDGSPSRALPARSRSLFESPRQRRRGDRRGTVAEVRSQIGQ